MFARHNFDKPVAYLTDSSLPTVAVRACPVQFKRPPTVPTGIDKCCSPGTLPAARSVFAVLTKDGVYVYDTHHNNPLLVCKGLHYAGLTDASWTPDGRKLIVTSSDGYLSLLSFENGELGDLVDAVEIAIANGSKMKAGAFTAQQQQPPPTAAAAAAVVAARNSQTAGQAATLEAPPAKKARRTIVPTAVGAIGGGGGVPEPAALPAAPPATQADASKGTKRRIAPSLVTAVGGSASSPSSSRVSPSTVSNALGAVSLQTVSEGGVDAVLGDHGNKAVAGGTGEAVKKKKRITPDLVKLA